MVSHDHCTTYPACGNPTLPSFHPAEAGNDRTAFEFAPAKSVAVPICRSVMRSAVPPRLSRCETNERSRGRGQLGGTMVARVGMRVRGCYRTVMRSITAILCYIFTCTRRFTYVRIYGYVHVHIKSCIYAHMHT